MGGCAGKNKSKKSNSDTSTSKSTKGPNSRAKDLDKNLQPNVSLSLPEKSTSSDGLTGINNVDKTKSITEQSGADPDVQAIMDSLDKFSDGLGGPTTNRVVSVTDAELEGELAKLVYGHPEKDYEENPTFSNIKSTEV